MKSKLRLSIQEHAYNEDRMLWELKARARAMGIQPVVRKPVRMPKFFRVALTATLVAAFVFLGIAEISDFNPFTPTNTITAVYALDINPSFEINVNKEDKVVSIIPTNEDAKSILIEDLYGKDSVDVIEELLKRAEAAGFIDSDDLADDYVLVTAVPMNENNQPQTDAIADKIAAQTKTSEFLQSLNVAVIKSDLITLRLSENKKVPIGLYVINGMVALPDNTVLSAKQFFSNPIYRATFQQKGAIKNAKTNAMKENILLALSKLDAIGVDTTNIKNRLISAEGKDLIAIQVEVRKLLNKNHLNTDDETGTENNPTN